MKNSFISVGLRFLVLTLVASVVTTSLEQTTFAAPKPLVEVRREYLRDQIAKAFGQDSATAVLCKDLAKQSLVGVAKVGVGVALTVCIYKLLHYFELEDQPIEKACELVVPGLLGLSLWDSGAEMKGSIQDFQDGHLRHRAKLLKSLLRKIQTDFQDEDRDLPSGLRKWLDRLDEAFVAEASARVPEVSKLMRILERREFIVRSIPLLPMDLGMGEPAQSAQRSQLEMGIQALLEGLPNSARPSIESLIHTVRDASYGYPSIWPHVLLSGTTDLLRADLVVKMSTTLGLPFCRLHVSDLVGDRLFGKGGEALLDFKLTDEEILGKLGLCLRDSGVTNPILVVEGVVAGSVPRQAVDKICQLLDHRSYAVNLPGIDFSVDLHRVPLMIQVGTPLVQKASVTAGFGPNPNSALRLERVAAPELEVQILSSPADFLANGFEATPEGSSGHGSDAK